MFRGARLLSRARMAEKCASVTILSGSSARPCPYGQSVWDALGSANRRRGLFFDDQEILMEESSPGEVQLEAIGRVPRSQDNKAQQRTWFGRAAPSLPNSVTLSCTSHGCYNLDGWF